jgi:predicted transcriptional regulator
VKDLTVTLDDEVYRRADMIAAERQTSLPALVREYLMQLAARKAEAEAERQRLIEKERAVRARIKNFSASNRLSRDELHDRQNK